METKNKCTGWNSVPILTTEIKSFDRPSGHIQWKGTDVMMDVHCLCGAVGGYVNGMFNYYIKCPECNRVYRVSPYVELVPAVEGDEYADNPTVFSTDKTDLEDYLKENADILNPDT